MQAIAIRELKPDQLLSTYGKSVNKFNVRTRGRPERSAREHAIIALRRQAFGLRMKALREAAGLTLIDAARLAEVSSPRKLSQYETTCYPPGDIVMRLAPHYGVDPEMICELVLEHSDPAMFEGLTGKPGFAPTEKQITEYLSKTRKK